MAISTYLANKLLDHAFRNTAYTPAATVYAALFTTTPTVSGGGTEVSGVSYARVAAAFDAAAAPSSPHTSNSGTVTFPTAGGSWGTATHFAIYDAVSGGNLLAFGTLTASKTVGLGDTASFAANALTASLT